MKSATATMNPQPGLLVDGCVGAFKSVIRFAYSKATSLAMVDAARHGVQVRYWQIVLKKSFFADD
jgi:hypothetical protein